MDSHGTNRLVVINERLLREGIRTLSGSTGHELSNRQAVSTYGGALPSLGTKTAAGTGARGAATLTSSKGVSSTQQLELWEVECLVLSYKKIGRISSVVGVDHLVKLHLDNNAIERIENLGHLKHLTWLDLSFNRIQVIEGLDELTKLENLSLYSNRITEVQGLDTQITTLQCLSLGKNGIDSLESAAKYLHKLKGLRMLTLSGNKIDAQTNYRARLIGYVNRLKYLDNRTVFPDELAKAMEDLKEYLLPVDEADRKEQEVAQTEKAAADEAAEYEKANIFDDQQLLSRIFSAEPEGSRFKVSSMLEEDSARDRTRDVVENYQEKFSAKAKELADGMKDIRRVKDNYAAEYEYTLRSAKKQCDDTCKGMIKLFESRMKRVIPFGLRARPEGEVDEHQLSMLKQSLAHLRSDLMEKEADQQDAYEALNKGYEEAMEKTKTEATEVLSAGFEDLRQHERTLYQELQRRFDAWHDERQRQAQDAAEGYADASHAKDKAVFQHMDNREDFNKGLLEWHELHSKRLDELEEKFKKNEERIFSALHTVNEDREHERNRARVQEIIAYVTRIERSIQQWETLAEM